MPVCILGNLSACECAFPLALGFASLTAWLTASALLFCFGTPAPALMLVFADSLALIASLLCLSVLLLCLSYFVLISSPRVVVICYNSTKSLRSLKTPPRHIWKTGPKPQTFLNNFMICVYEKKLDFFSLIALAQFSNDFFNNNNKNVCDSAKLLCYLMAIFCSLYMYIYINYIFSHTRCSKHVFVILIH